MRAAVDVVTVEDVRTILRVVVVTLGLGVGAVASSCDAPTFFCVEQDIGVLAEGCYCKDVNRTACEDWGDCISGCPVQ